MEIQIVWGRGHGATPLSSFDLALAEAGVSHFNLIPLTSVIPEGAVITETEKYINKKDGIVGDIMYVVMARKISQSPYRISTGLGWVQSKEGGIFLEMDGKNTKDVTEKLHAGLREMMDVRNWQWASKISSRVIEDQSANQCTGYGCVVVIAVFDFG